jgi:hypothetical protein
MPRTEPRPTLPLTAAAAALLALATGGLGVAQAGALFPQAFEVEHHLSHDDGTGDRFVSEAVVDTYGGSWIVSRRPDGSRLIVDLARRELTEVREEKGAYWTVSFDRFAELQRRLRAAQGNGGQAEDGELAPGPGPALGRRLAAEPAEELVVTEVTGGEGLVARGTSGLAGRAGVRQLRVAPPSAGAAAGLEVWLDPTVRLGPEALRALATFEAEVLSAARAAASVAEAPGRYLAAARAHAGGAFPVRTARAAALAVDGSPMGRVEDVATRLERLERFPRDLVEIPEGLQRVPHPLEAVVRFLEEEAERDEVMSGRRGAASPRR